VSHEQEYWLNILILMHENHCGAYAEFMDLVMAQWLDRCIRCDHSRIVSRALWGWA
jgi:hypothetical protein